MTAKKPTGSEGSEKQENSEDEKEFMKAQMDSVIDLLEKEKQFNAELKLRTDAANIAAFVYRGSVPLGEAGKRVGDVIVEAARVIEGYLSGNTN